MNYAPIQSFALILFTVLFVALPNARAQSSADMMNVIQDLCWSPDGQSIYFSSMRVKTDYSDYKPDKWSIYKYDRSTGKTKKLVEGAYTVSASPDGKRIALGKWVEGNQDIYLADTSGKIETRLTDHDAADSAPSWSPDGKQIAFNSKRTGTTEIFIINTDGTGLQQLTKSGEHKSYNPSWSPEGNLIAFCLEQGDGKDQIHIIKQDGTGIINLTKDGFNNIYPGWKGKNIVIYGQGEPGGKTRVFTVMRNGKKKSQVLNLESFYARYSPDGSLIGYVDKTGRVIKIIKANGIGVALVDIPETK